jgi:hypothetical protein
MKIDLGIWDNQFYFVSSVNLPASSGFPFQTEITQESVYSLFLKDTGNSGPLDCYIFYICLHKIIIKVHSAQSIILPSSFTVVFVAELYLG